MKQKPNINEILLETALTLQRKVHLDKGDCKKFGEVLKHQRKTWPQLFKEGGENNELPTKA